MDNSSLVIHAAAASDQGSYECQVTTEVDRVSLKHEVNVFNRSRIMEHPAHNTVIKVLLKLALEWSNIKLKFPN